MKTMRDFINFVLRNLVDRPDKIILDQEQDGDLHPGGNANIELVCSLCQALAT